MYSHYNYYQSNPAAAQQQQQQHLVTTTTTTGQVWNGQQWVATAPPQPVAAPVASYAQVAAATVAPPPPPAPIIQSVVVKHGKTHAELVQHYTSYYHHWSATSTQAKASLSSLPPPHPNTPANNAQREEMERREKWAAYYASNSAALAHYHLALSKGGGTAEPYARPASPPAPPPMSAGGDGAGGGGVGAGGGGSGGANMTAPVAAAGGRSATAASVSTAATPTAAAATTTTVSASKPESTPKKKSRWSTAKSDASNGKSTSVAPKSGAADEGKVSSRDNFYSQFVQEGQSTGKKSEQRSVAKKKAHTYSDQHSASASSHGGGTGTKRKKMDSRYDSSLSANGSYYGPSGVSSVTSREEEDYVPLGLNKALGGSKASPKKEKKKQKKAVAKQASLGVSSGFDSNSAALSERAHRFKGKGGIHDVSNVKSTVGNVEKYMGKTVIGGAKKQLDEHDYERMTVKGTCRTLEKEYLRLTSPPKAELVRPQPILERHLQNLKESYRRGGKVHNGKPRDYDWYCSQFKAIRQDFTVQRIINAFAVDVYETHAKVALEEDDINEYNQSQTQLKELYDQLAGKEDKKENRGALRNRNEFVAYRIIYYVFLSGNRKYDGGSSDIFKIMLQLTPEQRKDKCIHHALLVRAAVADNDYHKFFVLQDNAPNMGDYLMDKIVPSVRQCALQRICKAYRPSVATDFVLKELGFDPKNAQEVAGALAWLKSCGCQFDGNVFLTKDSVLQGSDMGVKNSLI